jgi:hypothetical protein
MFRTKVVEKIKTHILCSITFFLNRALYEVMWKNIVEPGRPQMTIWCMCIACWLPNTTNTHSKYVRGICFSIAAMVALTHLNVTLNVHCLSCIIFWFFSWIFSQSQIALEADMLSCPLPATTHSSECI